jgi:hypothetical protein
MSAVSSVYPNNFESVKAAKESFVNHYVNNHPNRLEVLRFAGTLNIEFDGRNSGLVEELEQLTTFKSVTDYDFATLPEWTRKFNEILPTLSSKSLAMGEFSVTQNLFYFWRFLYLLGAGYDPVKVGDSTITYYERDTIDDPWVETSTTTSELETTWLPYIGNIFNPAPNRGGDPVSGGRGPDNDENSVLFREWPEILMDFLYGVSVYRLPWETTWANESTIFTDHVADYIAAQNAIDDGGWTGSTTMALEFS